jgi:hypothetical protein
MRFLTRAAFVCAMFALLGGCRSSVPNSEPGIPAISLSLTKEGKVRFSHSDAQGTDVQEKEIGKAGNLFGNQGAAYSLEVVIAWPAPKTFEATVDFDSKGAKRGLKLDVSGFSGVSATKDGQAVTLPAELPEGKYRVVVKGTCP